MNRPTGKPQVEMEGKGLDYERYALDKLFRRLVRDHELRSVLEIPAKGEKAMPSLYSLAFAAAGCDVTLVNPEPKSLPAWQRVGLPVRSEECADVAASELPAASWDMAWNFMVLAQHPTPEALLREMVRLSRRYVMFVAVNRFNPGFFSHRTVHRLAGVPWNHGSIEFMNPYRVRRYFGERGLRVLRVGAVDTPPYPDSLGIRDMKLHRKNVDLNKIDWDSRTLGWMSTGRYPLKLKLFYFFEWLPLPLPLKLVYAHLFWVLAERGDVSPSRA